MKLLLVCFFALLSSPGVFAATESAASCIQKLSKVCAYSDFEAALFRCSWRKTEQLPAGCNRLFTETFQYMYYYDRPISQNVCLFYKAPCTDLKTDFDTADVKFNTFLKKNYKMNAEKFISLTADFKK
ncbi:MAG: hypothetical protein ACXVAX_06725 [Pseudobdellovibrio sp.]